MQLGHAEGPMPTSAATSAWHLSTAARADRVASLPEVVAVTVSVQVSVYHPTP
jgi:hypothetical protein